MRSAFAAVVALESIPAAIGRIRSAGTHATDGRPAQDAAIRVAAQLGVALNEHKACSIDSALVRDTDIVVCMDLMNEANMLARIGSPDRVFLVGDLPELVGRLTGGREIRDPYGHPDATTRATFEDILIAAPAWAAATLCDPSEV